MKNTEPIQFLGKITFQLDICGFFKDISVLFQEEHIYFISFQILFVPNIFQFSSPGRQITSIPYW